MTIVIAAAAALVILAAVIALARGRKAQPAPLTPERIDALVALPAGDGTNGLGVVFAKLFRQVFEQNPERLPILERMNVVIGIQDTIVQSTAITMTFRNRSVTIENGVRGKPDVCIEGDIETLVTLPALMRSPAGLFLKPEGRNALRRFARGELKIRGLLSNTGSFRSFRRLIR
ncbi:MAG: hypothetical protein AB1742_11085 [bacterium]